MKKLIILSVFIFTMCSETKKMSGFESQSYQHTIAFGSCSVQSKTEEQMWAEVSAENPNLWVWLGDNIYVDTEDMTKMKAEYDLQKSHPGYQELLKQVEVIGIWDDNDFGLNDGGKEYSMKDESRDLLFDFLDVDAQNAAWGRKGAYQSYSYSIGNKVVKVILLDARYSRDPLMKNEKNENIPSPDGKVLGEDQWLWLEAELSSEVDFFIVGSGIQVLTIDHRFEKWGNFPREREKLLNLVAEKVNVPLVFITGDRHISELSKIDLKGYEYPLYDITSSSLTNPWSDQNPTPNSIREGEIVYPVNFAVLGINWVDDKLSLGLKYVGRNNEKLQDFLIEY